MAESKGSLLAKSVQKHAGRAKEKLLQNLGKVDRTEDDIFDEHLTNYSRQQTSALRLQKEFGNYIRAIRTVQTVSKQLMDAISEVYETQWTGSDAVQAQIQAIEVLYQDYQHKLADQVLLPLNTYAAQFPEMRKKIDKRNRKLIDYDGQRHNFQNTQAAAAKKKDDIKITKGREQLDEARRTYEMLNSELHDELPALYDSRILFLVTNLQTLFASEQVFHNETAKIYSELESVVDKLATESQRGSYTFKKIAPTVNSNPSSPPTSPVKTMNSIISSTIVANNNNNNNNSYPNVVANGNGTTSNPESPTSQSPSSPSPIDQNFEKINITTTESAIISNNSNNNIDEKSSNDIEPTYQNTESILNNESLVNNIENDNEMDTNLSNPSIVINNNNNNNDNINVDDDNNEKTINSTSSSPQPPTSLPSLQQQSPPITEEPISIASSSPLLLQLSKENVANLNGNLKSDSNKNGGNININSNNNNNNNRLEQLYDIPVGATTTDLPPGVMYRVKATYRYIKEDVDELSFEVGDIIRVIEYDDPDDQEEGWLMGYKENSTDKGLFPANFTRPL